MKLTITITSEINDIAEWERQLVVVAEKLKNGDFDAAYYTGRAISDSLVSNGIKVGKYTFNPK